MEHLELRWNWRLDTGTREYSSVHELELSGVGPALRDDDAQQNLKAGDRERWSLKLMPEDAAFATMFETLGNVTQAEVRRVMRDIDDDQAASIEFSAAFGDRVRVRQQHQQLTGRQFRKTFHAAR